MAVTIAIDIAQIYCSIMMTWVFFLYDGKVCFDQQYRYFHLLQRDTVDNSGYFYCTQCNQQCYQQLQFLLFICTKFGEQFIQPFQATIELYLQNSACNSTITKIVIHFLTLNYFLHFSLNICHSKYYQFQVTWYFFCVCEITQKNFKLKNAKDEEEYCWLLIITISLVSLISYTTW